MKKFIQGMYQKKNFGVRLTAVILSVIVMGFALSLLVLVDLGTDPCTSMNLAISEKIGMESETGRHCSIRSYLSLSFCLAGKISDLEHLPICF